MGIKRRAVITRSAPVIHHGRCNRPAVSLFRDAPFSLMIPRRREIMRHLQRPIAPTICITKRYFISFLRRCFYFSAHIVAVLTKLALCVSHKAAHICDIAFHTREFIIYLRRSFLATIFPQGRRLKRAAPALYVVFCSGTKCPVENIQW